ncbi:hypothetical protein J6590_035463 [Homalodisca vitripennis]|nr:hypothetical protein J6590_035463 [Homalodisca vitripennis]
MDYSWNCGSEKDYSWNCGTGIVGVSMKKTTAGTVEVSIDYSWNCESEYGLQLELWNIGNVAEKKFGACGRDKIDTGQSDESREIFCSGSLAARLRYSGADLLQDLNSILSRATNSSC